MNHDWYELGKSLFPNENESFYKAFIAYWLLRRSVQELAHLLYIDDKELPSYLASHLLMK